MSPQKPPASEFRGGDESPQYYSNIAQVSSSMHDFRIRFAQVGDSGTAQVVATVYLSPGHAKSLLKVLAQQIGRFEAKMGTIATEATDAGIHDEHKKNPDG